MIDKNALYISSDRSVG